MVSPQCAQVGTQVDVATTIGPAHATIVECPFYDPKKSLAAA